MLLCPTKRLPKEPKKKIKKGFIGKKEWFYTTSKREKEKDGIGIRNRKGNEPVYDLNQAMKWIVE